MEFFFVPTSQCTGNSARASGADCRHWRSRRVSGLGSRTSPRRGRPFFRGAGFGGPRLRPGFLPALNGRGVPADMPHQFRGHPLRHQGLVDLLAQPDLGKFLKGPRKGGLGGDRPASQNRRCAERPAKPARPPWWPGCGVVIHRLGHQGPGQGSALRRLPAKSPGRAGTTNFSIWTNSKMLTNCRSFSVNGRSQHSSRRGIKFRCKVPINHDTASLSFIGASLCCGFSLKITLAQERR